MHSSNAAVLAFTLLGCNEITSDPETPNFELVDPAQRLDAAAVNSHIHIRVFSNKAGVLREVKIG